MLPVYIRNIFIDIVNRSYCYHHRKYDFVFSPEGYKNYIGLTYGSVQEPTQKVIPSNVQDAKSSNLNFPLNLCNSVAACQPDLC